MEILYLNDFKPLTPARIFQNVEKYDCKIVYVMAPCEALWILSQLYCVANWPNLACQCKSHCRCNRRELPHA